MSNILLRLKKEAADFLITIFACSMVAVVIFSMNNTSETWEIWRIFMISYTYGIVIHLCIFFWNCYFPEHTREVRYAIPSLFGFTIGTLIVVEFFVLGPDLNGGSFVDLLTRLLCYALLSTMLILYVFIVNDQKTAMRTMLKVAQLKQEKNEKELLQSKLRLLQSQIEPHFLFNTLANLRALISIDPEKSEILLDNLTALLRQSLKQTRDEITTLEGEINFCRSYLAIQHIRIGERLQFTIDIAKDVDLGQPYPPLLLLPIVENAILHGIEPVSRSAKLKVTILNKGPDILEISVFDNGIGLGNSSFIGHGVGLNNIRSRIQTLYGLDSSLDIEQNEDRGVTVTLRTPPLLQGVDEDHRNLWDKI